MYWRPVTSASVRLQFIKVPSVTLRSCKYVHYLLFRDGLRLPQAPTYILVGGIKMMSGIGRRSRSLSKLPGQQEPKTDVRNGSFALGYCIVSPQTVPGDLRQGVSGTLTSRRAIAGGTNLWIKGRAMNWSWASCSSRSGRYPCQGSPIGPENRHNQMIRQWHSFTVHRQLTAYRRGRERLARHGDARIPNAVSS